MKLQITFFILSALFTIQSHAQLYVKDQGKVAIGTNNITSEKVRISSDQNRTLYLFNDNASSASKYGLYNYMSNVGTNVRYALYNHSVNHTSNNSSAYGFYNYMVANGTGLTTAIKTSVVDGTGIKYGIENYVRQGSGSTRVTYGTVNRVYPYGSGKGYAGYHRIYPHGSGERYTLYLKQDGNNRSTSGYGLYNRVEQKGPHLILGQYNDIFTTSANAGNASYGVWSQITGTGTGTRYGIYSTIGGGTGYAGYFVGDVHINGTLTQTSDERLKENIEVITDALDIVNQLSPRKYNFKDMKNQGNKKKDLRYGFLAQDLEAVLPSLVHDIQHPGEHQVISGEDNNQKQEILNELGHPVEGEQFEIAQDVTKVGEATSIKAINYIDLIPLMVQAIQEQQEIIDQFSLAADSPVKGDQEDYSEDINQLYKEFIDLKEDNELLRQEIDALKNCTNCVFNIDNEDRYRIYPNPTSEDFIVSNQFNDAPFVIHVISAEGKLVKNINSDAKETIVRTENLASGTYSVMIYEGGNLVSHEKLVVLH